MKNNDRHAKSIDLKQSVKPAGQTHNDRGLFIDSVLAGIEDIDNEFIAITEFVS
ncbi:MAG: hypothetical protein P9M14_00700 [Candidatus Alcyoniella australis]|nr:hypothetical protein [Candidatus Alcyoniella australis]